MTDTPKVRYWAVSLFTSKTFLVAVLTALTGLAAEPEILAMIPLEWLPRILMTVGVVNVIIRRVTKRPVAIIMPGTTKAVEVERLGPPAPGIVSD